MDAHKPKLPKEATQALELFREFELSKFIDSGANGYILIGRHTVLQKDVAIKIYFHQENEVDQEPAIISQINHENVLKVYDARKVGTDCSYFMMLAANYGDLSDYLSGYDISVPLAHKLLCQLLSGISALHEKPNCLVHRDLKPENLLVHDDKIVIADFGSVRQIDNATQRTSASKHSILYRPLEAFGPNAFFDYSSDIYQAGIIGYLLFGGKLSNDLCNHLTKKENATLATIFGAYEKESFIDSCIENRIKSNKLIKWDTLPIYVPNNIRISLKKATSTINKRYKNASEFLAVLSRTRGDLPNWIYYEKGFELRNWTGKDYLILDEELVVLKKKHGSSNYRKDNSYSGNSIDELYQQVKERLNLN